MIKWLVLFWGMFPALLYADVIIVDSTVSSVIPGTRTQYLESAKNAYTIHDFLNNTSSPFTNLASEVLYLDETDYREDVWLKFSIVNTCDKNTVWFMELNSPSIDYINFFLVQHNQVIDRESAGDAQSFSTRDIQFRNPVFRFSINPTDTYHVYIQLNAGGRKIHAPIVLHSPEHFVQSTTQKDLIFGLYYGILLLMALMYFYLAYSLKERIYLYFAVYIFLLLLSQAAISGVTYQVLWPDATFFNTRSVPFFMALTLLSGLLFARSFVLPQNNTKILRLFFNLITALCTACALLVLGNIKLVNIATALLYWLIPCTYLLLCIIGSYALYKKFSSARLFVPGLILAAVAIGIMTYYSLSRTSDNIFTNNLVIFFVLLKCILLSIAMLDRLKIFKEEKENAQQLLIVKLEELNKFKEQINEDLERKVEEKSKELIEKQNEVKRALLSGEEKERKRVAQELHDGMGSLLSTLRLNAESINLQNKDLADSEIAAYKNVLLLIDRACTELRTISHNMLPPGIEHLGLESTLKSLVQNINQTSNVNFEIDIFQIDEISGTDLSVQVYRIILELIHNILKHANATQASVQVVKQLYTVSVMVSDNGVGFDHQNRTQKGLGLVSLQSRVEALNGELHIDSTLNKGTTINISIPLFA